MRRSNSQSSLGALEVRVALLPDEIVYIVGDVGGHSRLRDVEDGERFAFQGRVYEAEVGDGSMQVHHSGETVNRVADTFRDRADTVVDLRVRDVASGEEGTLTGTPDHPFYVVDRDEPVEMGELEPGQQLRGEGGAVLRVEAVDERADDVAVFNFEVEDVQNYHVAAEGFGGVGALVGNKASLVRQVDLDDLSDAARAHDRGGLTKAGRSLQKHGNRSGSDVAPVSWTRRIRQLVLPELLRIQSDSQSRVPSGFVFDCRRSR